MKKAKDMVEVYETGREDFLVDIARMTDDDSEDVYTAWLYRRGKVAKLMMCVIPAYQISKDVFLTAMVEKIIGDYYERYDKAVEKL